MKAKVFHQRRFDTPLPSSYGQQKIAWTFLLDPTFWWFYRKSSSWGNLPAEKDSTLEQVLSALLQIYACRSLILSPLHRILPNTDLSVIAAGNDSGCICIEEHIIDLSFVANKLKGSYLRFKVPNLHQSISASRNNLLPNSSHPYISWENPTLVTAF